MCERLSRRSIVSLLLSIGTPYLIFECSLAVLESMLPVLNYYSLKQSDLHDSFLFRDHELTHTEGSNFLVRMQFIKAGLQLMQNLLDRSYKCLYDNSPTIEMFLAPEWLRDVHANYAFTLDMVEDMDRELDKITKDVEVVILRRNKQIKTVLGLVYAAFLPLTFISGIFGMNFSSGGVLVDVLAFPSGSRFFWGLCGIFLVLCILIFMKKGWIDMLGTVEKQSVPQIKKHQGFIERQNSLRNNSLTMKGANKE